ncbi:MAG: hypothetical protein CMB80_03060 [Flammeovirgaceae bacterium]|nr:hypothetical protein [Flammeovirgaceae bacterium]|tara:strand:- start:479 stop:847 length:369 start_codon:yes stop_codon:yes gene_type:complete
MKAETTLKALGIVAIIIFAVSIPAFKSPFAQETIELQVGNIVMKSKDYEVETLEELEFLELETVERKTAWTLSSVNYYIQANKNKIEELQAQGRYFKEVRMKILGCIKERGVKLKKQGEEGT